MKNSHASAWFLELYKSLGLTVIPIHYGEKTPAVPSWKKFQSRRPSDTELAQWFSGPFVNIGIVCGSISDNLVVVDFDDRQAYRRFFSPSIEKDTITVQTSKGLHVYLRSLAQVSSFKILKLKIDVKAEGSYVIAPPSLHPSGKVYEFTNSDVTSVMVVEDAAASIRKRARELGALVSASPSSQLPTAIQVDECIRLDPREIAKIVRILVPYWIPGSRNNLACALLGFLIKRGVDEESASRVIDQLAIQAGDEEREARLKLVRYHYRDRISLGSKLKGSSGIREIIVALRDVPP